MARRRRARLLAMPVDGPFPNYSKPLFQGETKCEAVDKEMIFHFHANSFSQQNFVHLLASF